jgi:hypothetical protein
MPDNLNQPKATTDMPLEPAPEVINTDAPASVSQPSSPNPSISPNPPIPPTPPSPPPPLPESEILTPDIAPKKASKTKIILTSIIGLFLLGAVAGAVVLVKQNQDMRKYAAEGDSCEYGQACTAGDHSGTQSCNGTIQGGTCKYDPSTTSCGACGYCGDGDCGGGEGSDNCPQDCTPPVGDCISEGSSGCTSKSCCTSSNVCHNNVCTACGTIGDEGTCWTHANCHWESGSCRSGPNPNPGAGECQIDCGADRSGVSVTAKSGFETKCQGATVTAVYFAKTCNSSTSCAGTTTTTTGSLPFNVSTIGNDCGYYQTDITASTSKGGTCDARSAGPIGACTTPTVTAAPTSTTAPTPTIPSFSPTCPENIMCAEGSYSCTGEDGCLTCCAIACECVIIKVYDTSWREYPERALSGIKPGDTVIFTVQGQTTQGTIDKARFKINGGDYQETTTKKAGTQEYYYQYTIPSTAISMNVEAQVHLVETESWY